MITRRRVATAIALAAMSCNPASCPGIAGCFHASVDDPPMLPHVEPIAAAGGLSAARCGVCHAEIYAEWSTSLMAHAATNPFFFAERAEQHGLFLCGRCHHPLENQEPVIVTGLRSLDPLVPIAGPNPRFDPALRDEGVTCAVCHLSPELAFWPETPPPRDEPQVYNARTLPDAVSPHPLSVGPALADPVRACVRCHQFDPLGADTDRPALDTVAEYERYRAAGGAETCVSCHMPAIERRSAPGAPVRTGHDHRVLGVRDGDFVRRHVELHVAAEEGGARLELVNRAGHNLPTGEPSRVLQLDVRLAGAAGEVASRRLRILRDMDSIHVVDRFDNSLAPGERRVLRVPFSATELAPAREIVVSVVLARYEQEHPLLAVAGPAVGGLALTTHVLTATVALPAPESRNVGRGGTSR